MYCSNNNYLFGAQAQDSIPTIIIFYYSQIKRGGRKVEGVGVMKDKELKLEEIEASLTLGGAGAGRVQGRGRWFMQE